MKEGQTILFGGSFDPFHLGHKGLIQFVLNRYPQSEIILIPTRQPPHKEKKLLTPEQRLAMINMSLKGLLRWRIEECELNRVGPSYTLDTLDYLEKTQVLVEKPFLMIGDDWVSGFHRWKNAPEIARRTSLMVFHRTTEACLPFDFPHVYLDNPIRDISSSQIRERVKQQISLEGLVDPSVEKYIGTYGLYRD